MDKSQKETSIEAAIAQIPDGASIMLGGFGAPGTPFTLIRELVRQGQRDLTIIKNDANETNMGVDHLLANGQVKKLIVTHIGLNPRAVKAMNAGELEVEFCPQGIFAERIRIGGAGIDAFITDIGVDTELAKGKPRIEYGGKTQIIESALKADFALVHADCADQFGNLIFAAAARNFNPLMAMAGHKVIVEAERVLPLGEIAPDESHISGAFVDQICTLTTLSEEYAVVRR